MERESYMRYYESLPETFMPEEVKRIFCRIPSQWNHLIEMALMETAHQVDATAFREKIVGSHEELALQAVDSVFGQMEQAGIRFVIHQQRLLLASRDEEPMTVLSWYQRFLEKE